MRISHPAAVIGAVSSAGLSFGVSVCLGGLVPVANEAAEGSPGGVPGGGGGKADKGAPTPQPECPPPGEQQGPRRGGC